MTRRMSSLQAATAALTLLAAGCSSSGATPAASGGDAEASLAPIELAGTSWTLVDLDGTVPANVLASPTLEFRADGNAGGTAGCNTYNGTYTVDDTGITFGPLLSTKKGCEQPLMMMETTYLNTLQGATSYGVDGAENLVLSGSGTLTFSPA